jgi:hypothetical protein
VTDIQDVVPHVRDVALATIDVSFSESIDVATFTFEDIVLLRDGNPVPLNAAVTMSLVAGTTYRINGLETFTATHGAYELTVQASGIEAVAGSSGSGSASESWIVISGLDGDYNNNGRVEQGDLDLVLLNWGIEGTPPPLGWINDLPEGIIDQAELDAVLLDWGDEVLRTAAASAPLPAQLFYLEASNRPLVRSSQIIDLPAKELALAEFESIRVADRASAFVERGTKSLVRHFGQAASIYCEKLSFEEIIS